MTSRRRGKIGKANRGRKGMLAMLGLVGLLAACGRGDSQQHSPPGGGMPPVQVGVITVEPRRLPVSFEYAAQTAGYRDVEVRARATGIL